MLKTEIELIIYFLPVLSPILCFGHRNIKLAYYFHDNHFDKYLDFMKENASFEVDDCLVWFGRWTREEK